MNYSAEIVNSETEGLDRSFTRTFEDTNTLDDRDLPTSQGSMLSETDNDD